MRSQSQNLAQFAQAGSSRGLAELGRGEAEGLVESGGEVVVAGEAEIERQVGQGQVRLFCRQGPEAGSAAGRTGTGG